MKRAYLIFTLSIALLSLSGGVSAQSFLKKLSKGIENVSKELDKMTKTSDGNKQEKDNATETVSVSESTAEIQEADNGDEAAPMAGPVKKDNVIKDILKGNVKEIIETNTYTGKISKNIFRFNEEQQLTGMELTSYNNNVSVLIDYEYNNEGQLSKRTFLKKVKSTSPNMLGAPNEINEVSIDEEPFAQKIILSSFSNNDNEVQEFIYQNGRLIKTIASFKGDNTGSTEVFYNSRGDVTKRIEIINGSTTEYTYDSKGKVTSQITDDKKMPLYDDSEDFEGEDYGEPSKKYDPQGRLILVDGDMGTTRYTYNQSGYLTLIKTSDRWWGDASTSYTLYTYDAQKNWTKRTMKKTGEYYGKTGITVTTSRVITYY